MLEPVGPNTPAALVEAVYARFPAAIAIARQRLARPLTLAEKILVAHADEPGTIGLTRGTDYGDPSDYDRVRPGDRVDIVGLAGLAPGRPVTVVLRHPDGTTEPIATTHTMSDEHIAWFRAGSALNLVRQP
jgi:hypothetical protein